MGDWMTVNITGRCEQAELPALRKALDPGDDYSNFHCLSVTHGVCGLGDWTGTTINRTGNLAERDYDADSVREALEILAKAAPSLRVKVHCGGPYESRACTATVTLADGKATVGPPEVKEIGEIPEDQMRANMMEQFTRPRGQ